MSYHVATQFGLPDLKALRIDAGRVDISIASGGCTNKDTLEASVDKDGRNEYEIAFEYLEEDNCEAYMPDGVDLGWSYAELGIPAGAYVRVLNRVEN